MKLLSIIIPFLNEERTITATLDRIIHVDLEKIWYQKEILLVNDWSTDNSEAVILPYTKKNHKHCEIRYIKNPKNIGKWWSVKNGIKHANGDVYIIQDADSEYEPNDYLSILHKMDKENLDIVYWSRILWLFKLKNTYSKVTFLFGGLLVSFLTSLLSFNLVTDEPTCYKTFKKKLRDDLLLPTENWFEWEPAITMLLLKKGYSYWEVPIHYKARNVAEGKKIKWQDWVKALKTLLKWRFF